MINFEPLISWPWAILIGLILLLILGWQLYLIVRAEVSKGRKILKSGLILLFTFLMLGYIFQPILEFASSDKGVLIYSKEVGKDRISFWKDSLKIKKAQNFRKFDGEGSPIFLLGDNFSQEELWSLNGKELNWISDPQPNQLTFLEWKGMLRQGEVQAIYGKINSEDSVHLKLVSQNHIVKELTAEPNSKGLKLEFPVSILGRNEMQLIASEDTLGIVKFYVYPSKPISYSFQFSFPDPEIRLLSAYLKKQGNRVNEEIQVSRNAKISTSGYSTDSLQILLIDPTQLKDNAVSEAIDSGASVFIMNLSKPEEAIQNINQELKTSFEIKKSSSSESREIGDQLTAASYEFEYRLAQKTVLENSIAIQQIGNSKVGVSLLNQTFPIQLSGDSLRYSHIWNEILGAMTPNQQSNWNLMQPVFQGLDAQLELNKQNYDADHIIIGSDSIYIQQSLVNPFSKTAKFVTNSSGWVSLSDSLEMYSYSPEEWPELKQTKLKADFLKSRSSQINATDAEFAKNKFSDWVWYVLILLSLTLLWAEPKIRI